MENLTLEQCFEKIRLLIDYDFIEEQRKYAYHLLEVAKNDKNLKRWIKEYYAQYEEFRDTLSTELKKEKIENLLWTKYQMGFFNGFDRGLEQVARGILESLENLKKQK